MYPSDPVSVHQLRRGQLIETEQSREPWQTRHAGGRPGVIARMLRAIGLGDRSGTDPASTSIDGTLELFVGLDRPELSRLARLFTFEDLEPGDSLGHQGEQSSEFVVVLEGRIGISIDGLPHTIFDAGSHFGALPLLDDGPDAYRRASFSVLEHSRVAVADRSAFLEILADFPVVAQRIKAITDVRRAYFKGRADARAAHADSESAPFPVHI